MSGGPMLAGRNNTDLISVFEGVGAVRNGTMTEEELEDLTENACPGCGSCSGMYTANTMNCLCEAMGVALPATARRPPCPPPVSALPNRRVCRSWNFSKRTSAPATS